MGHITRGRVARAQGRHTVINSAQMEMRAISTAQAIKWWLKGRFNQQFMSIWTIDNYDGRESYEELGISLQEGCEKKTRLQPDRFHQVRELLVNVEGMMEEVMNNNEAPGEEKRNEWHRLRHEVLETCDG